MHLSPPLVDERLRKDALTLPGLRHAIPAEYAEISDARSWRTLGRVVLCAAICLALLTQLDAAEPLQLTMLLVLWVLYGWVLVGLFVIGHDCGHRSFSQQSWINTVIGHCCMAPLANGFQAWRLTHDHHHAFTQRRGSEVDWASYLVSRDELAAAPLITRLGYQLPFGVLLWITWNALRRGSSIELILTDSRRARDTTLLRRSNAITLATLVVIYGGLWYTTGLWGMLKYHGIPATVAMITGWMIITIQHANEESLLYDAREWTPARGQLVSTFDIRFPRMLEWLWCDINIHIPHHVAPGIPWYYLKRAGAALRGAHPELYQEQRFTLRHISWFYRTPFLTSVSERGYFVMEPALPASQMTR